MVEMAEKLRALRDDLERLACCQQQVSMTYASA